ncbi:hypothetical protein HK097_011527 [Rhizophlyctis rosea]|uniref:Uncharacterized protein n=1 Tax=Rhizophlyctis rosea TaxID=64517 RepID=A0AAD5SI34_9FUNG|nr:hypothetical protein HK097_011527 [Rhizophlyctis rosea]
MLAQTKADLKENLKENNEKLMALAVEKTKVEEARSQALKEILKLKESFNIRGAIGIYRLSPLP